MLKARPILVYLFACCLAVATQAAEDLAVPQQWRIESTYPFEHDLETGITVFTNQVTIFYGTHTTLSARRGTFNQATGEVEAEGNVQLEREGHVWRGERLRYHFLTGKAAGEGFRTGVPPMFIQGEALVADQTADVYVLADGAVTTDDLAEPGYRIVSRSMVVVPGEYVEARHATLRLGNTPIMYFPYFRRNLKQSGSRFSATPGYRSVDGPYLLTSYNWYWNEVLDGTIHLDGRFKRGVGFGPDVNWNLDDRIGRGSLKSYYLNDDDPGRDSFGNDINRDRYRLDLSHFANPRTNLTLKGRFRYQSDEDIIREFFESEFRENVQPSTFLEANQLWSNYSLNVYAQPRVNDFYETVERLPDVQLTGFRQQIGQTPLFYESQSSAGWYQRKFANDDTNHFSTARADTMHQVVLPWTLFNWLNVTPRVGGRFTHYNEADGKGSSTDEENRWLLQTGMEVSTKASRVWPGVRNNFWEVDGLRHIIQPLVNYAYIPDPSPEPSQLPQYDYRVPTTELLPIYFPNHNSIDAFDSQNVLRFGIRNKLQTKRQDGIDNLIYWALFMDWHLDPESGDTERTYSNLYSDISLKPFSWLTLTSRNQNDLNDGDWRLSDHVITLTPNNRWSFSVGQRYLNDEVRLGPDSEYSLWFGSIYYRINDNWGLRLSQRYNSEEDTMEEQQYTLYRDLRSWTSALSLRVRKDEEGPTDVTAAVTLSLKAFPRFGQGDDTHKPSLLIGN